MMKKLIAILLAAACVIVSLPIALAQEGSASLYSIYGDGMLFKQNETATVSGTANDGTLVTLELYNPADEITASGSTTAQNGTFEVSFNAPEGGYDEYEIVLKADGNVFATLNNVVFGEQWLSSGQSNMEFQLAIDKEGETMLAEGKTLDKGVRALLVPHIPEYNGSTELTPSEPQTDIPGAKWVTGESLEMYSVSAVSYYFAEKMRRELDMPVGILNVSLGATDIDTWIPREAIDGDAQFKNELVASGQYIEKDAWNEEEVSVIYAMSACFNLKVAALKGFKLSGMLWYQGETEIASYRCERYAMAFDLMQRSYTEYFGYRDGLLPIVYSQLASHKYFDDSTAVAYMNGIMADIQAQRPDSRAVVTLSDLPLTYYDDAPIHPDCKRKVGERMAYAADGLVYGKRSNHTAATMKNAEYRDGSVYVTFDNVGDGLAVKGSKLFGFAVCGGDGIYVQANAEIVDEKTVRIWNDGISEPCSASYAYYINNQNANLYSTCGDELVMPVSSFVTDKSVSTNYWMEKLWADCETEKIWHCESDEHADYYDMWSAKKADICISSENAFSGDGGLGITSKRRHFSVSPVLTYKKKLKTHTFYDTDTDYSKYSTLSFYVRNNGEKDVELEEMRFYTNSVKWYAPAVSGTQDCGQTIPADGEWHLITLDLNTLYLSGNECGLTYANDRINDVESIKLCFGSKGESDISVDNFRFTPSTQEYGIRYDADIKNADNLFEIISAIAVKIIKFFANK